MDVEAALLELERLLAEARPVPLSASVMVNRSEVEQVIAALRAALPEEIRQARWVIKEREELLAQAAREAEQLIDDGRVERDRMVADTEVARAAERERERIIARAEDEARRTRLEAEDYIDGKLANFEIVLQKTLRTVERGRERLRGRLAGDDLSGELDAVAPAPAAHEQVVPAPRGAPQGGGPSTGPFARVDDGEADAPGRQEVGWADLPEEPAGEVPPGPGRRGVRFYDHESM